MSGFNSARTVIALVQLIGWAIIALGVGLVFLAGNMPEPLIWVAICLAVALSGLFTVALAQVALAIIVTAESTHDLLAEVKRLGAIASAPGPQPAAPVGRAPAPRTTPTPGATTGGKNHVGATIKTFGGYAIVRASDGVTVGTRKFKNVLEAEKYISGSPD